MRTVRYLVYGGLSLLVVLGLGTIGVRLAAQAPAEPATPPADTRVYPQGTRFPLGLYSLDNTTPAEMQDVAKSGWNLGQTYGKQDALLQRLDGTGINALAHLPVGSEGDTAALITAFGKLDRVAWWDFPEEQRFWLANEFTAVKNIAAWTRRYDPLQRPNYMYIPGHYTADQVAKYVPYVDIIGPSSYTDYMKMPRAFVRNRIATEILGIQKAGYTVGPDYLHKQRVPIGVLMLFASEKSQVKFPDITPAAAYHDFYSSLAAGARGILVFSYFHRKDTPAMRDVYQAYAKAAAEVSGPEQLGTALLFGKTADVTFAITKGPQRTVAFTPPGRKTAIGYPALNVRALTWQDTLYLVAVNSTEDAGGLTATLKGLPATLTEVRVPFENRTVPVKDGTLTDTFAPLGVHVYIAAVK